MKRFARSQAELAAILGRSVVMLNRYAHEGCPCSAADQDEKGRYRVAAIKKWIEQAGYVGSPAEDVVDCVDTARLRRAQAREREAKAELARLELERRRGELMRLEDVHEEWRKRHIFVRETLLSWKRSLAPILVGKSAQEILGIMDQKIDDLMRQFSGQE